MAVADGPTATRPELCAFMKSRNYPHIRTCPPGPRAQAVVARDRAFLSNSCPKEYPLVIAGGEKAMVEDVDGNRYIDFMAGIAVSATGYNHPAVTGAIKRQADQFLHICGSDFYYEPLAALAERLARAAPGPSAKRTFLCNSGTEAVEAAIKLARFHTRKPALIAFNGAFHGRTYGALSLSSSRSRQRQHFAPLVPEVYHVSYPDPYRGGGSEAALGAVMRELDALLRNRVSPDDVAAVFVEPILGEGGYVIPPSGFLRSLRAWCDRHGILLAADEVQCGVGRTGRMWACEWEDVEPDILITAKGLGSGMPIAAMVAKQSVMTWEPGHHGSTFGGNPVCCAAALATLDTVESFLPHVREIGDRVLDRLRPLAEKFDCIGDVRGRGLMVGLEFVENRQTRIPDRRLAGRVTRLAFERGLLLLGCGMSTIRIAPPLIVDEYDVDKGIEILTDCIELAISSSEDKTDDASNLHCD